MMMHVARRLAMPWTEAQLHAVIGVMLWGMAVAILQPGWSPALLAFGPLVIYPLVFEILGPRWTNSRRASTWAFVPALASYAFDQGLVAGALAMPWLVFAVGGLVGHFSADWRARQYALVFIRGYLIVGAAWLVLARLGERPLDFSDAIVHATAVHFHFAGFVLPVVALKWAAVATTKWRLLLLAALLGGVPLVAMGITLSALGIREVELASVWCFVAVCVVFAMAQMRLAFALPSTSQRFLLMISSGALIVAMGLASAYATASYMQLEGLDIPLMLRTHGPIQVFGFALPGVLAWARLSKSPLPQTGEGQGGS
jgi:hypothetical protein